MAGLLGQCRERSRAVGVVPSGRLCLLPASGFTPSEIPDTGVFQEDGGPVCSTRQLCLRPSCFSGACSHGATPGQGLGCMSLHTVAPIMEIKSPDGYNRPCPVLQLSLSFPGGPCWSQRRKKKYKRTSAEKANIMHKSPAQLHGLLWKRKAHYPQGGEMEGCETGHQ